MHRPFAGLLLGIALVSACGALPSGVPLSNTGGVLEDTGTDRDRQPHSAFAALASQSDSKPASVSSSQAAASTVVDSGADAGATDGAVALGDGGVVAVPWAGEYYGSDRLVRHFDGEADDVELDDKAHTRVEEPAPGTLVISIVNSATSDVICALHASAHGAQASLDAGQSCFGDDGSTATTTDGRVSLSGDRLVLDFGGKVVESSEDDDDDDTLEFRLDYHFDGQRR